MITAIDGGSGARTKGSSGSDMPKPKKTGGRAVKLSPLTIARIEVELLAIAAALKAMVSRQ
jgi:hypothetical protein